MGNPFLFLIVVFLLWPHAGTGAEEVLRCDLCSKPVGERYWQSESGDRVFCEECVRTRPKCFACGVPVGEDGMKVYGQTLCRECFLSRPRCADCGLPILERYYQVEGLDEKYCDRCYRNHPHCRICGRPFGDEKGSLKGSAEVCPKCRAEAVTDPLEVRRVFTEVRRFIEADLALKTPEGIALELQEDLGATTAAAPLQTYRELGAFVRTGNKPRIVIQEGLPRPLLYETLAHELAHAWQSERAVRNQRLLVKEGFAQWVAGKVLAKYGHEAALRSLRSRSDLYGQGFRLMEGIERRRGTKGVVEYAVKSH